MAYRATDRTEAARRQARDAIVVAATDQVAEGGFASAGVQAVARRAGVATGTVYRHFPSKAQLFAEVFRRASQRELDVVAEVAGRDRPAAERIAAAVEVFARRALAGPALAWALIAEPADPAVDEERLAFRRGYRDVFEAALEDGIEAGEFEALDTQTAAAGLVGAIGEVLVGPLSPLAGDRKRGGRDAHEALVASLVHFCLSALNPARERSGASGGPRRWPRGAATPPRAR